MNHNSKLNRPSWASYFFKIAEAVSTRSHDAQTKVGAVIVDKYNRILSTGYNGFPPGCDDDNLPNTRPEKYPFMIHAELNAIISTKVDLKESTLYTTYSPCIECAKAIAAAGIRKVYYKNNYQNSDFEFVSRFLKTCNITTEKKEE